MHKIDGAHLQYVNNHLGKVWMKSNENFWSYRLHKLGTPKVMQMDGWMDGGTDRVEPLLDLLSLKRRR